MSELNRYFRIDIPLVAPEEGSKLAPRLSSFQPLREESIEQNQEQIKRAFDAKDFGQLRGKREFAYHVMALMVKKEYGNIRHAIDQMVAVDAQWEHKPFLKEVDGEIKQVVPFSTDTATFSGGFHTAPAEEVVAKEDGAPKKVAFEWRTNLY
jgi:hypothetical protein